jgi:hypothetical protein
VTATDPLAPLLNENHTCDERRSVRVECHALPCTHGSLCANLRLARQEWAAVKCEADQLVTVEAIAPEALVIELLGEVFAGSLEFASMLRTHGTPWPPELCFLDMGEMATVALDVSRAGSLGRAVTHSATPNCELQSWIVDGKPRIGVYAKADIPAGAALTVDYSQIAVGPGRTALPSWW